MVKVGQKKLRSELTQTDNRLEKITTGENQIPPTWKMGIAVW